MRSRNLLLATAAAVLLYGALALRGTVPGGWRLRSVFGDPSAAARIERDAHRRDRLEAFAREPATAGGVLFMGSSTVEFFDLGAAFPGATTLNRGIGDEPVAAMARRLDTTLARHAPRAVVLYAASVDARRPTAAAGWRPVEELLADVQRCASAALRAPSVETVMLLGVLPETSRREPVPERVAALNLGLEGVALALGERVRFLDTRRPPLVDPGDGLLQASMARDRLHLNGAGSAVLAGWLREVMPGLGP
ncbi:MAG: GDSL-type esterase/lipase family protein [Planctomycetota bacterium]|nr:GDSL-type esterase/lipase family protein [Planctomycetota bacterium]